MIYLIHYVVLMMVVRSAGVADPATAAVTPAHVIELVVVLAVILLLSRLAYAYYEAPARLRLRALWGPAVARPRRALTAAVAACPALLAILVLVAREPILVALQSGIGPASTHVREACAAQAPGSAAWRAACGAVAALSERR